MAKDLRFWRRRQPVTDESLEFICNICSTSNVADRMAIQREANTCNACGSILRWRSIIAALSTTLYGSSRTLADIPTDRSIRGLGMSDWDGYASRLSLAYSYQNTFYDEPPRFDVMAPVAPEDVGSFDFIISSDVLGHVAPPYERALHTLRTLLGPGGVLVISVPMISSDRTVEHYPELHDYAIARLQEGYVLVNRTSDGELQVFDDLDFHGGPGATLEMRVFSATELMNRLVVAGFDRVTPFDGEVPEHGIIWNEPCSFPIIARVPD